MKALITTLHEERLIDGLGWQLHTTPDAVLGDDFVLAERMQWVEDLGLKNFVTEMDIPIGPGDEALARQGEAYRKVAETWLAHNGGGWLQTWGVYDKYSWLGEGKRPLLLDDNYAPKPAYNGVLDALKQATSADFDDDGDVDGEDFLGWQRGAGDGGEFDADDLRRWQEQFGAEPEPLPTTSQVPELSTGALLAAPSTLVLVAGGRRWRGGPMHDLAANDRGAHSRRGDLIGRNGK